MSKITKMNKSELIEIIDCHFATEGKKMSNLSKATIPRLNEIIEKHKIVTEDYITQIRQKNMEIKNAKKEQKVKEEEEAKIRDEKYQAQQLINTQKVEDFNKLNDETKQLFHNHLIMKIQKAYLEDHYKDMIRNLKLIKDTDNMEANFRQQEGARVKRTGKNELEVDGVVIINGGFIEPFNYETEMNGLITSNRTAYKFDEIKAELINELGEMYFKKITGM